MKKIITLLLFLGVLGGVSAQTFDFSCADELVLPDGVSFNRGTSITIDGSVWTYDTDQTYVAPVLWHGDENFTLGIWENSVGGGWTVRTTNAFNGVILTDVPDRMTLQVAVDYVRTLKDSTIYANPDSSYDHSTGIFRVEGVTWERQRSQTNGGDDGGSFLSAWNAPDGWGRVTGNYMTRSSNGFFSLVNPGGTAASGTDFQTFITALLEHKAKPTLGSGDNTYNPNTNVLRIGGMVWSKEGNIHSNPSGLLNNGIVATVTPRDNGSFNYTIVGNGINRRGNASEFDRLLLLITPHLFTPLSHDGVIYNSSNNTFSVDGVQFEKQENVQRYDAPPGWSSSAYSNVTFLFANNRYGVELNNDNQQVHLNADFSVIAARFKNEFRAQVLSHDGVVWNNGTNTFSIDGIEFERENNNSFIAPPGFVNDGLFYNLRFKIINGDFRGEFLSRNNFEFVAPHSDFNRVTAFIKAQKAPPFYVHGDGSEFVVLWWNVSANNVSLYSSGHDVWETSEGHLLPGGDEIPGQIRITRGGVNSQAHAFKIEIKLRTGDYKTFMSDRTIANVISDIRAINTSEKFLAKYNSL